MQKKTKKLVLSRSTIRSLNPENLSEVAGGSLTSVPPQTKPDTKHPPCSYVGALCNTGSAACPTVFDCISQTVFCSGGQFHQ